VSGNGTREDLPVDVDAQLEQYQEELATIGNDLDAHKDELDQASEAWEQHYDSVMESLEEQYAEENRQLPGEDIRISRARRGEGWETWARWRRAERKQKRLEKQLTRISKQISARQSQLKQMQLEAAI
jgi:chromosome segregation ATPase